MIPFSSDQRSFHFVCLLPPPKPQTGSFIFFVSIVLATNEFPSVIAAAFGTLGIGRDCR
jgi:hypothetical protein